MEQDVETLDDIIIFKDTENTFQPLNVLYTIQQRKYLSSIHDYSSRQLS